MRRGRVRGTAAVTLAWVLALGGTVVVGEPALAAPTAPPGWVGSVGTKSKAAASPPWRKSTSAPLAKTTPTPPATFAFPEPASWDTALGRAGAPVRAGVPADGHPVQVVSKAAWATGESLRVTVLDRAAAQRVGASGFVFTVSDDQPEAGVFSRTGGANKLPVEFSVDYSGFAQAYGAGYADRLRVVALADCAVAVPVVKGCDPAGVQLPVRNDVEARKLTVEVADLAGLAASVEPGSSASASEAGADGATAVFAVISAVGGDNGTFAATQLSSSGSWQVSPGSGEFSYSYPISVPEPAGGSAPTVALGYSSGAIDGLTLATNPQASQSGLGWSNFANAFIQRNYEPCYRNVGTLDLCWLSDNATISLAGISGPLVQIPAPEPDATYTEWQVLSNPGWRIQRFTGASYTTIYQGQYWRVTAPDGTVYHFGIGHMPGRTTNSTLGVPVLADNSGEPCRTANNQIGECEQGWRWYLDRVTDPDGNLTHLLYERETGYYSAIGGLGAIEPYHRAASLKEIIYGGRGWDANSYSARVLFGLEWRCTNLNSSCPVPTAGNASSFPDVPNDLICTSTSCSVHSPSFYTGRRYSYVRTEVKIGTEWEYVAQHNIIHGFGDGLNGVVKKLQINSFQHAGIAFGGLGAYPLTSFTHAYRDNRVDHGGIISKANRHNRITKVTTPFGGTTTVTYGFNRQCTGSYSPPLGLWDRNVRDCFPQSIKDGAHLRTGVFNKYLVTQVVEAAGVSSPNMTTTYAYGGDPAWAFDTGAFARDEDELGWSMWRGYGESTITKGTAKTRLIVFRGWHDDLAMQQGPTGDYIPTGRRNIQVQTSDGSIHTDYHSLAGYVAEEQDLGTLNGVANTVLQSRRYEYERRTTPDPGDQYFLDPEWVGRTVAIESVATSPGVFRQRRSQTTYNAQKQATTTLEEGWLDQSGDERCSITTYADNLATGMVNYPAANKLVAGDCASTNVLTLSETYYDGSTTLGAAPSKGNVTRQRTLIETNRWSETTTEYDTLGRVVKVTDPTGAATTTSYTVTAGAPSTQIPIKSTVTNALGQQTTTEWHPEFGIPKRETDVNGNVTDYSYDMFGRVTGVWLPTEPVAYLEPSWRFSYDLTNRAIRSQRLVSESRCCTGVVWEESWVIYDGFWRERQTQSLSSVANSSLVSETTYDDRGLLRDETVEQVQPGTPGVYRTGTAGWPNRTRHLYDELGREIRTEWHRDSTVARTTITSYGVDAVTVTGPDGRQVRERVDGLGRTVAVEEFDGSAWVASSYGYDLADRLTSVTDPAGNRITYGNNLAGWRTSQQDPNRGAAVFAYDNAGRQTDVLDASWIQIHNKYDPLGRQTERRYGSATGPLLASWVYDTAPGGKGQLHKQITHDATGDWVSEVIGYDIKGRVTGSRLTVPAGIPGLSGQYAVTQTYDRADRVRTMTYPALGGLPAETITTDYSTLGLPTRMAGLAEYVWGVTYDSRGRKTSAGFGPKLSGGATWMAKSWTYDVDQRINGAETYLAGSAAPGGIVSDHEVVFDPAGNLKEKLTRQNGLSWRECFGYDARSRLTSAHTITATTACDYGQPGTGDRPYSHSYQYSPDGKLMTRTENGVSTSYTYPASGSPRPHAPTQIGTDTYQWNAVGNLTSRTVGGVTETFTWNVENLLKSVTGPSGKTEFVYDPTGQRLLRRAPNGQNTLYVAGHEITANTDGSIATAVRSYTFQGTLVATRSLTGVDYLVSDQAGSVEMAVPASGQPSATRAYAPYGRVRAQTGDLATDRGFLGQVEDTTTGLSYLNARYYDAKTGVFISTDPIYDTGKVKTLNPYSYSTNNPTTYTDPSGLYSAYAFGLEQENSQLRAQNKELIAHIGKLGRHIEYLQDVIRKQQRQINKLITYVRALEAEIARQVSIIRQLQARVAYLQRVVYAQQREISRLRSVVARQQQIIRYQAGVIRYQAGVIRYQAGVIRYQAGVIGYYKGVVNQLGGRLWGGTPQYASIMSSIHSFRGVPAGAFRSDRISTSLATIREKNTLIANQQETIDAHLATYETGWDDVAYDFISLTPIGTGIGIWDTAEHLNDLGASEWIGDRMSDAGGALSDAGDWASDRAGDLFELRPPRFGF